MLRVLAIYGVEAEVGAVGTANLIGRVLLAFGWSALALSSDVRANPGALVTLLMVILFLGGGGMWLVVRG